MFGRPRTGSAATSLTQARRSGGQTEKVRGVLSDRRQRVLAALIEEYVARALPVGSRTLTERYQLGVSPATVRNELSVLEDGGYIAQPHTSAGRIPTDAGYRAFVDNLLVSGLAPDEARYGAVVEELRRSATELDALLERTSAALARLTDCLSIVLAPSVLTLRIKQISLISLSSYRVSVHIFILSIARGRYTSAVKVTHVFASASASAAVKFARSHHGSLPV